MSYFKHAPKLNLETEQELLNFLHTGEYPDCDTFEIRSAYIIQVIKDVMKRENRDMAYNTEVTALVRERLELNSFPKEIVADEGSMLSRLVYNAQCYLRSEKYISEGYQPFTKELVEKAFLLGKKICVRDERFTIMVNGVKQVPEKSFLTVRMINGNLYCFRPRMRRQHVLPDSRPAKIA